MEQRFTVEMTDHSLMMAVLDGDVAQLGVLFERYHRQLFNFLFRLTGNRFLSEDLVQEVFVRILKYRHSYQDKNQFVPWMFQIARNARVDYARRSPCEAVDLEDHAHRFICPLPRPDETVEKREEMSLMLDALAALPVERREVLLLRGFHGLKFEEIAMALNCSVNTIKGRAFTAIRELRTAMDQLKREKTL